MEEGMGGEEKEEAQTKDVGGDSEPCSTLISKDLAKDISENEGKRVKASTGKVRGKRHLTLSESPLSMYGQMPERVKLYGATRLNVLPSLTTSGASTRPANGTTAAASHKEGRKDGGVRQKALSATAPGAGHQVSAAAAWSSGYPDHKRRDTKKQAGSPVRLSSVNRFCEVFGTAEMYASCAEGHEEHEGHATTDVTMADAEFGRETCAGSEEVAAPQEAVRGELLLSLLEKHEVVPLLVSKRQAVEIIIKKGHARGKPAGAKEKVKIEADVKGKGKGRGKEDDEAPHSMDSLISANDSKQGHSGDTREEDILGGDDVAGYRKTSKMGDNHQIKADKRDEKPGAGGGGKRVRFHVGSSTSKRGKEKGRQSNEKDGAGQGRVASTVALSQVLLSFLEFGEVVGMIALMAAPAALARFVKGGLLDERRSESVLEEDGAHADGVSDFVNLPSVVTWFHAARDNSRALMGRHRRVPMTPWTKSHLVAAVRPRTSVRLLTLQQDEMRQSHIHNVEKRRLMKLERAMRKESEKSEQMQKREAYQRAQIKRREMMREIDKACQEIFDREVESLQDPISRIASPMRSHFEHQDNDKGGGFAPRSSIPSRGQSRSQTSASSTRDVADHHLHLRYHHQSRAPRQRPKKKQAYELLPVIPHSNSLAGRLGFTARGFGT